MDRSDCVTARSLLERAECLRSVVVVLFRSVAGESSPVSRSGERHEGRALLSKFVRYDVLAEKSLSKDMSRVK